MNIDYSNHWYQRLYDAPQRIAMPREELVMWTTHRIEDALDFGEFLYTLIESTEEQFDGTLEWFDRAFDNEWIERPRWWPRAFVSQALTIANGHTSERFAEWLDTKRGTKGISFQSYVRWLSTRCQWAPTYKRTDRQRMLIRSHRSSVR